MKYKKNQKFQEIHKNNDTIRNENDHEIPKEISNIYIYIHISKRKTLLIILVFIQYYNNRISTNSKLVREYNKPTN